MGFQLVLQNEAIALAVALRHRRDLDLLASANTKIPEGLSWLARNSALGIVSKTLVLVVGTGNFVYFPLPSLSTIPKHKSWMQFKLYELSAYSLDIQGVYKTQKSFENVLLSLIKREGYTVITYRSRYHGTTA